MVHSHAQLSYVDANTISSGCLLGTSCRRLIHLALRYNVQWTTYDFIKSEQSPTPGNRTQHKILIRDFRTTSSASRLMPSLLYGTYSSHRRGREPVIYLLLLGQSLQAQDLHPRFLVCPLWFCFSGPRLLVSDL